MSFWLRPDVQHFLRHVDQSNTIFTERWGDLLWHSLALKLFLDVDSVHMFKDWAYEHVTLSVIHAAERNYTCLLHGAFAIDDAAKRLSKEAEARTRALFEPPFTCDGIKLCVNGLQTATDRPSAGYYLGAVSPEQASCHRRPHPPYHCGLPPDRIYSFFRGAWVRTADNKLMSPLYMPLYASNKAWFGSEPPLCQSYKRGHPYPTFTTLHCNARFPRSQCQRICTSCKRLQMNWGANPNFGNGTDADPREVPG